MNRKCNQCGVEYKIKPSHAAKSSYCSSDCMAKSYSERLRGVGNPNYKGVICEKPCKWCSEMFMARPERVFCSRECHSKSMVSPNSIRSKRKRRNLGKTPSTPRVWECRVCSSKVSRNSVFCKTCREEGLHLNRRDVVCGRCGEQFTTRNKRQKYCSKECYQSNLGGESNPNYKGGITSLNTKIRASEEYAEWRMRVFSRDGFRCVDCGATGALHAHHILSFSKHPDLRFEVTNGLTLCHRCHATYHPNMNMKIKGSTL